MTPAICSYAEYLGNGYAEAREDQSVFPQVIPNWDNTPRSGHRGLVLHGSTPELFRTDLRNAISAVSGRDHERRLVFVKSWNEWAEGNHLEPDQLYGRAYLEVLKDEVPLSISEPVRRGI
jgi:hypothetical protein